MAKIKLKDVHPFDGEYEFDPTQEYNGHELHLIKKVAGIRLNEIEDAATAGDYDLFVSLAVIALWRAGKIQREDAMVTADLLLAASTGSLVFDFGGDARPPDVTETERKPEENSEPSSPFSNGNGDDHQEKTPERIGLPG
jgi:hypothetical protein